MPLSMMFLFEDTVPRGFAVIAFIFVILCLALVMLAMGTGRDNGNY